jgi:hypothetical protein
MHRCYLISHAEACLHILIQTKFAGLNGCKANLKRLYYFQSKMLTHLRGFLPQGEVKDFVVPKDTKEIIHEALRRKDRKEGNILG